jgi:radical SAM protein with 4Fe4S-binding SPASM domain
LKGDIGSLLDHSLSELWQSSEERKNFITRTLSTDDRCFGCDLKSFCRTCPAREELEKTNDNLDRYYSYMQALARGFAQIWKNNSDLKDTESARYLHICENI